MVPQVVPAERHATPEDLHPAGQEEYTAPAFILPGAQVWFGPSCEDAHQVGVTRRVNWAFVYRPSTGQTTLRPDTDLLLKSQDHDSHGRELLSGVRLTEVRRVARYGPPVMDLEAVVYFQGSFFPENDGQIFLVNARIVQAPRLNPRFGVLVTSSANVMEVAASGLTEQGWARTSTTTGSL